jgi:hypothetical protein
MSLSAAVGAPAPITIAGKTYTAAPLDLFGLGEVEEWARAMALSYDSPEIENYIRTSRGMFTFISVSLAIRHPEMTPQAVATAFTGHTGEVGSAFETIARISGLKQGGADAAEGGKPTGEVVAGA